MCPRKGGAYIRVVPGKGYVHAFCAQQIPGARVVDPSVPEREEAVSKEEEGLGGASGSSGKEAGGGKTADKVAAGASAGGAAAAAAAAASAAAASGSAAGGAGGGGSASEGKVSVAVVVEAAAMPGGGVEKEEEEVVAMEVCVAYSVLFFVDICCYLFVVCLLVCWFAVCWRCLSCYASTDPLGNAHVCFLVVVLVVVVVAAVCLVLYGRLGSRDHCGLCGASCFVPRVVCVVCVCPTPGRLRRRPRFYSWVFFF